MSFACYQEVFKRVTRRSLELKRLLANKLAEFSCSLELSRSIKAKFHYTGPTGPDRTRTDFVGDPHGPSGVARRPGPQKSPRGSGRARVVEFSYNDSGVWV